MLLIRSFIKRRSQSKASYLSYRREPKEKEKGLPNFQGSYKRTMSPSGGRLIETSIDKPIEKVSPVKDEEKLLSDGLLSPVAAGREKAAEDKCEGEKTTVASPASGCPEGQEEGDRGQEGDREAGGDREAASKTLPRGYPPPLAQGKTRSRAPRAQSDPTCSAKLEKKTVSASTQDNLDELVRGGDEKSGVSGVVVGRSQSERTAAMEARRAGDSGEPRVSDASSQTTPSPSPPPTPPRRQLQEEIECDRLSRDLASQLSPSHKLHGILVPGPDVKRTTDYVSGLFRMDFAPRPKPNQVSTSTSPPATAPPMTAQSSCQTVSTAELEPTTKPSTKETDTCTSAENPSLTTAECKARLLPAATNPAPPDATSTAPSSIGSLQQKKEELMLRLSRKLSVLREESIAVTEETAVNEALGSAVSERVERVARPHEVSRFKLHVMEVGHITSLLLSLSGRLARAENALLALPNDHHDRKALEEKRDKLLGQLNEAKQLKSNIDQRSGSVSSMLYNYLTGEEYTDYDHFINMKSKLLVDSREIAEKIQLGEEQLAALKETLDQVR